MAASQSLVMIAACLSQAPFQDKPAAPIPIEKASKAELSQWVTGYYQRPDPKSVPARIRRMSELGILTTDRPEANTMFFGQIMKANPDRIAPWMESLAGLPEKDLQPLHKAVWMSNCDEGRKWLADQGLTELAEKPGHPFFTGGPIALEPYHVDMLWEWFFATGDEAPIRVIVSYFNMLPEDPGETDLPQRPTPGGDRATYLRKMIGGTSVWSASSLASRHPRLLEILKKLQNRPDLPDRGGKWLGRVIEIAEREGKAPK